LVVFLFFLGPSIPNSEMGRRLSRPPNCTTRVHASPPPKELLGGGNVYQHLRDSSLFKVVYAMNCSILLAYVFFPQSTSNPPRKRRGILFRSCIADFYLNPFSFPFSLSATVFIVGHAKRFPLDAIPVTVCFLSNSSLVDGAPT